MALAGFTFLLGAKDPEMDMIEERILRPLGLRTEYAQINGTRAHPGNAYHSENKIEGKLVLVECGSSHLSGIKIDHHNPGDPGYDIGADNFMNASSLGQIIRLALSDASAEKDYSFETLRNYFGTVRKIGAKLLLSKTNPKHTGDSINLIYDGTAWLFPNTAYGDASLPQDFVHQAAADHCLAAAYAGKCPGINKEKLKGLQARNMSKTTSASLEEVLAAIKEAEKLFTAEREKSLGDSQHLVFDFTDLDLGAGYSLAYLALKEAGTILGKPYLVSHCFSEGTPRNLMLNSASEEQVTYFQKELASKFGLTDMFGSPSRGYAGGVIH